MQSLLVTYRICRITMTPIYRITATDISSLPACTLVLGGARSGKSTFAEDLVLHHVLKQGASSAVYIATGQAFDAEMEERIRQHRARRDQRWHTIECPINLPAALQNAPKGTPVLIDCLTIWLSNLILDDQDPEAHIPDLLAALAAHSAPIVCVSNEVGAGIVPDNALARQFRDAAGRTNQAMAAHADFVVQVSAGMALALKGVGE
jgi:adenosylcobinamide kinase/adenosylcobinamide-phosphate guanylyltransferase